MQERFTDFESVFTKRKVFGAALQRGFQNAAVDPQRHERVRENVGRDHVADRDVLLEAFDRIRQTG